MEIDAHRLKKAWKRYERVVRLRFDSPTLADTVSFDELLTYTTNANTALTDKYGSDTIRGEEWLLTPKGWTGILAHTTDFEQVLEWLDTLADTSGDTFTDTTATAFPESAWPHIPRQVEPTLAALIALPFELERALDDREQPAFAVNPRTTASFTEHAVPWTYLRDSRQYLYRDMMATQILGTDHELAMSQALHTYRGVEYVSHRKTDGAYRSVHASTWGFASACNASTNETWHERTDSLRETLLWQPQQNELSFITHSPRSLGRLWSELSSPRCTYYDLYSHRSCLREYTPDAFGIQVLTDAHLKKAHDLSTWKITPLPGGRHLVEAHDLTPWYAEEAPDPHTQEQARRDFGDLILTSEIAATFPHTKQHFYPHLQKK